MNVLSYFDGLGTGKLLFNELGISTHYYAAEVDKYAHGVALHNSPDIFTMGDVRQLDLYNLPPIDYLIGGSPCTNVSVAGKQAGIGANNLEEYLALKEVGTEFEGQSFLFWEFIHALRTVKPKFFLLENVRMRKSFLKEFNAAIGIEPTLIDAKLVSAQNRSRYYWHGALQSDGTYKAIPVEQPSDAGITLSDIVHERVDGYTKEKVQDYVVDADKTKEILEIEVRRGKVSRTPDGAGYVVHGRSVYLGEASPDNPYLFGCITPERVKKGQNGRRFNTGEKSYTVTVNERHGFLIDGYIRRTTVIESERLQGLADNTTQYGIIDGVVRDISNTQRFKMIGNGWCKDAIKHVLKANKEIIKNG